MTTQLSENIRTILDRMVPGFLEQDRQQEKAAARCVMAYTLSTYGYGPTAIGRIMGRDHATMVYSRQRVKNCIKNPNRDPLLWDILSEFNSQFQEV